MTSVSDFNFDTIVLTEETAHWINDFYCGYISLDKYVKQNALKESTLGKGVNYLVVDNETNKLVAYYTLRSNSLLYFEDEDISTKKNINEVVIYGIPCIEVKMFAGKSNLSRLSLL
ncbi:hypothetical protein [Desulfosporosinus sp.]|uniref:hypothetical protein n=1 Tax=Desulfosporosinus sp. TaxID=157907 RepID=UPI0023150231|nr:hypothetical protein [Desulfosporosinus sp.]MCO5388125.1 hypothetical protein [Desulfosporosinus sp.]MDA8221184.1 hypothetical protein [Desulfitobacterium hafniense]